MDTEAIVLPLLPFSAFKFCSCCFSRIRGKTVWPTHGYIRGQGDSLLCYFMGTSLIPGGHQLFHYCAVHDSEDLFQFFSESRLT